MNEWPAFEKEDDPNLIQVTEQEVSWLLPQSLASLAGELAAEHEEQDNPATVRLISWVRSVSAFSRPR
ncbi:hypothetical protein N5D61_20175 [Pseudomonas sp. GD03842]|uniref:hypothetical protein n=1 Tax=unclassified Pseudomonas TaxID=196821 RepID=UPI0011BF6039|nr:MULTISPECIES: hypothetical protein [unclassified Pseudomonas]MDH0748645.1 hypothetical protein [Pseudomonas sp. GD03842]